jgi:hypothetical protein
LWLLPPVALVLKPAAVFTLSLPLALAFSPVAVLWEGLPLALALRPQAVLDCAPPSVAFAVEFGVAPVAWQITAQAGGGGMTTSEAATRASALAPTRSERFALGGHPAAV